MASTSISPEPRADYAVLLLAYGAPSSLDEVEPYLLDVRGGRPTPPTLVAELRARYAAIGGRSPLLDRTREQAAALAGVLGGGTRVYVAMRHWHPYIADVLARMRADGVARAVALPLAPHFSRLSVGAYGEHVEAARGGVDVAFVAGWHAQPRFLDAVAHAVRRALARFEPAVQDRVPVLFTAHSLPSHAAADGDPYAAQLRASVDAVVARLGPRTAYLAFQSAGRSGDSWLGPDAADVLADLAARGVRELVLCPIGFVSDHLEVLYDVDVEYRARAERLGMRLERTDSLNACPDLVAALAELVHDAAGARGWEPCASR